MHDAVSFYRAAREWSKLPPIQRDMQQFILRKWLSRSRGTENDKTR